MQREFEIIQPKGRDPERFSQARLEWFVKEFSSSCRKGSDDDYYGRSTKI